MPVVLGENLTLEENKLSAVYKELYTKLNKAYAWTNTQTTSSGGTAVVLCNGGIISSLESQGNIKFSTINNNYNGHSVLIDGKYYTINEGNFQRLTDKENLQQIYTGYQYITYCSDNEKIYKSQNQDFQEYFDVENIQKIIGSGNWGYDVIYIKEGKIYYKNINKFPEFDNCYDGTLSGWQDGNDYKLSGFIINDGYLYKIYEDNAELLSNNNNWVKIIYSIPDYYNVNHAYVFNSDNEIYFYNGNNSTFTKIQLPSNNIIIKKFQPTVLLSTSGKIYERYDNVSTSWKEISNGYIWSDISNFYTNYESGYGYGISDNKLYLIRYDFNNGNNNITFTQLGTESGYTKIDGDCEITNSISDNYKCAIAYTGESTTVNNTIYTTKKPQISDSAYINPNDFNNHTIISNVTTSTITDQYRTYTRDPARDSRFENIPPATAHETVSVIDILAATNPNN